MRKKQDIFILYVFITDVVKKEGRFRTPLLVIIISTV